MRQPEYHAAPRLHERVLGIWKCAYRRRLSSQEWLKPRQRKQRHVQRWTQAVRWRIEPRYPNGATPMRLRFLTLLVLLAFAAPLIAQTKTTAPVPKTTPAAKNWTPPKTPWG